MSVLELVRWIELQPYTDSRGTLTAIEGCQTIPFEIKRVFFLTGVVAERAGHAHRDTHQVLIGLSGCFQVELSDGREHRSIAVDRSDRGLYLPPMTFARLVDFSPGAVMLALASTHYDPTRSIRSWDEFLQATDEPR